MITPTLPSNGMNMRCGHNFSPRECPYIGCGYRDTLILLDGLLQDIFTQTTESSHALSAEMELRRCRAVVDATQKINAL